VGLGAIRRPFLSRRESGRCGARQSTSRRPILTRYQAAKFDPLINASRFDIFERVTLAAIHRSDENRLA
jgi:hypothetical protein